MSRDAFFHDPREPENNSASPERHPRKDRSASSRPVETTDIQARVERPTQTREPRDPTPDSSRTFSFRERSYRFRESELHTLTEVGTFRAVAAPDLARFCYANDSRQMECDIRRLRTQGFLAERTVRGDRNKTIRLLTLTRTGSRFLKQSGVVPEGQTIYYRFVKPREAQHDANLYRLYQSEAERIRKDGGRPTRVVLDFELKRHLYRDLAGLPPEEQTPEARARIAERHGLAVVDGKIPLPDLRLEYDTAEMEHRHLDLELATRNYRPQALAAKARAGFSIHAPREDASRLRRVLDERELSAEIFAL
jgi:hypothetical protein